MYILANITQILLIGKLKSRLNFKNIIISLIPFTFIIFLTFYELTFTYKVIVYYLAIFMSLFHLLDHKNGVIRQGVIILFVNYVISFTFAGVNQLSLFITLPKIDLNFFIQTIATIVVWFGAFKTMEFFKFTLDETSSILELLTNIITIVFSVFLAFILDTRGSSIFYIYSDILYYLILLSYILIFLVGRLGLYVYNTIIERENVLINNIEFQKNKLAYLKSNFDERKIKLLSDLINVENYEKAFEVTSSHFDFKTKTQESIKKVDMIENELISTFVKNKLSKVDDLSLSIDIDDSLFDLDIQTYTYFFEILGIILDNAIEAAHQTMEKRLDFFIERPDLNTVEFIIRNSASQEAKKNLQNKVTKRGVANRMNGLRILDILVQRTDIIVITNIEELVTTRVILS